VCLRAMADHGVPVRARRVRQSAALLVCRPKGGPAAFDLELDLLSWRRGVWSSATTLQQQRDLVGEGPQRLLSPCGLRQVDDGETSETDTGGL